MGTTIRTPPAIALAVAGLVAAGCGSGGATTPSAPAAASAPTITQATTRGAAPAAKAQGPYSTATAPADRDAPPTATAPPPITSAGSATASKATATATGVALYRSKVDTGCQASHRIKGGASIAKSARTYAQRALPLAQANYRRLAKADPPRSERSSMNELLSLYGQALQLYQQILGTPPNDPQAGTITSLMATSNQRLQNAALAAGLPDCGPPVVG